MGLLGLGIVGLVSRFDFGKLTFVGTWVWRVCTLQKILSCWVCWLGYLKQFSLLTWTTFLQSMYWSSLELILLKLWTRWKLNMEHLVGKNVVTISPSIGAETKCLRWMCFCRSLRTHARGTKAAGVAALCQTELSGGLWLTGFRLCCLRLPFRPNGHWWKMTPLFQWSIRRPLFSLFLWGHPSGRSFQTDSELWRFTFTAAMQINRLQSNSWL